VERAHQLAISKDLPGTSSVSKYSLSSIPDNVILDRVDVLGVSLGSTNDKMSSTISNMKNNDNVRTLIMLKKSEEKAAAESSSQRNEVIEKALSLSLDLGENEQKGSEDHEDLLIQHPKTSRARKR
jgi:hypothetical protein